MPKVLISDALSDAAVQIFRDRGIEVDFQPKLGKDKEKLAEIIGKHGRRGMPLYVEGSMSTSEWTDKEGVRRTRMEINARELIMLGGGGGVPRTAPDSPPAAAPALPFLPADGAF